MRWPPARSSSARDVPGQPSGRRGPRHVATAELTERFPHHSGHGIGLSHPDVPFIVPQSTDTLEAGDVVTLEPGNYIKGVGGMRYKPQAPPSPTGFENLTHHAIAIEA